MSAAKKVANIRVLPSVLSADFSRLGEEIHRAAEHADGFHMDVMDGAFVPNLSFGAPVFAALKAEKPFDVHLMTFAPERRIQECARAGAASISFHVEVETDHAKTLADIRDLGCEAGLAISPDTAVEEAADLLENADFCVVMSVYPGFSGQQFLPQSLEKITDIRGRFPDLPITIDGGMNAETAPQAVRAGATQVVSGAYFWSATDMAAAAASLRGGL